LKGRYVPGWTASALSVLAVLAFHVGRCPAVPGGFLGVEVFFSASWLP